MLKALRRQKKCWGNSYFYILNITFPSQEFANESQNDMNVISHSYSPCHVSLVIISIHSLQPHLQPTISETGIHPCHDAKHHISWSFPAFLPTFRCYNIFQFSSSLTTLPLLQIPVFLFSRLS